MERWMCRYEEKNTPARNKSPVGLPAYGPGPKPSPPVSPALALRAKVPHMILTFFSLMPSHPASGRRAGIARERATARDRGQK